MLLKGKEAKESEILIYFNFLCFLYLSQPTGKKQTYPFGKCWVLCSGKENRVLNILNIFLVFFYIHSFTRKYLCVIKIDNHSI